MLTEIHLNKQGEYREKAKEDSDSDFSTMSTCSTSIFSTEETYQILVPCGECNDDWIFRKDGLTDNYFQRQPHNHILSNGATYTTSNSGPGSSSKSLTMRNKRQEYFDRLLSLTTDYDETIEEDGVFSDRREDFILSPIKMFLKSANRTIESIENRETSIGNWTAEEDQVAEDENVEAEVAYEENKRAEVAEEQERKKEVAVIAELKEHCLLYDTTEGIDKELLYGPLEINIDALDFSLDGITTGEYGIWSPEKQRSRQAATATELAKTPSSSSSSSSSSAMNQRVAAADGGGRVRHRLQRALHSPSPSHNGTSCFQSPCSAFFSPPCFRRRSSGEAVRGPGSACKPLIVEESERKLALSDILLAPPSGLISAWREDIGQMKIRSY